jgi:ketosteroid isomerase-like protein
MNASRPALAAALAALHACSTVRLPGTDIPDVGDNRAIYDVLQRYRAAVERRDAAAVLDLVSATYFDDAGTPDPADDLDFVGLAKALPADLARVSGVRVELAVTGIELDGERATAYVRFDARYRVTTKVGEIAKAQADVSRIGLVRENNAWKIRSGL